MFVNTAGQYSGRVSKKEWHEYIEATRTVRLLERVHGIPMGLGVFLQCPLRVTPCLWKVLSFITRF